MGSRTRKRRSKHLPGVHLLAGEIQPGQRVLRYPPARLEELQGARRVEFFYLGRVGMGAVREACMLTSSSLSSELSSSSTCMASSPLAAFIWERT